MTATFYDYSFTVTLKPAMYKMDIDAQYDATCNELHLALRQISTKFTMLAELTKNMNIHYHGVIRMGKSKRNFVNLFRNHKKFGFINIRVITNGLEGWSAYLKKDLENTYFETNRRPIIIDNYEIFTLDEKIQYGCTY